MMLRDSGDPAIKSVQPEVQTEKKWIVKEAMNDLLRAVSLPAKG